MFIATSFQTPVESKLLALLISFYIGFEDKNIKYNNLMSLGAIS